jgi:FKBP-type peptidyl-prolyl cis-trans isomerase FkpA
MNRSRKIAVVVSVLAFAGLAVHAQTQPASGSASAAAQAAGPAKAADGSETWPSGLVFRPLKEGTGASPSPTDTVKVHYRGTFPDGKEFDSSYTRGQPAEFPLNRVIPCWTEGVQKLKVGGKAKLICPPAIAYGAKGAGGVIPPNATLHFDVELIGIAGR